MENIVTDLIVQKNNAQRVNVFINNQFAFGLSRLLAISLKIGQEINTAKINQLLNEDKIERAYQKTLHFLSFRSRSKKEIIDYLNKNGITPDIQTEVITKLQKIDLVNDDGFAKMWVENRNTFRPRGKRALQFELKKKGIQDEIIEDVVQNLNEDELAYQAIQKFISRIQNFDWIDFRSKGMGYLSRRGFGYETSSKMIKKIWNELHPKKTNGI